MKTPKDVYAKLAAAYNGKRGVKLTAEDVDALVLRDQAILDLAFPDREGSLPNKARIRKARTREG
jgi:hypothetical protein